MYYIRALLPIDVQSFSVLSIFVNNHLHKIPLSLVSGYMEKGGKTDKQTEGKRVWKKRQKDRQTGNETEEEGNRAKRNKK